MTSEITDPASVPDRQTLSPEGQPIGLPLTDWEGAPIPKRVTLVGKQTVASPLMPHQARTLFPAYVADETGQVWTYMTKGPFVHELELAVWIAQLADKRDPLFFHLAYADGAPIGIASLMRIDPAAGSIEIGNIAIVPAAQRTRGATEALFLLMHYAMDHLGYRRLEWKCDALNAPSRRAATRFGFRFEGIFLNATIYKGRNRDTAWYAITDAEWPSRQAAFFAWLQDDNFDAEGQQRQPLAAFRTGD